MSTLIAPPPEAPAALTETVADLLQRLGDIPPYRVRLHPAPGTATEMDVVGIEARENRLFELIDGVLVEKGMGYGEALIAGIILTALNNWILPRKLGVVAGADGMLKLYPGAVRIPDVGFISWQRLPKQRIPTESIPLLAPELVVEVLSKSNTKREMERKRTEYFNAGVILVWEVDPPSRSVNVYTSASEFKVFSVDHSLDGGSVLPGFVLSIAELFVAMEK